MPPRRGPPVGGLQVPTGVVKWFSDQRGYGFIIPDDGANDLFVHRSNIEATGQTLRENQKVEFEVGTGRKGPEATSVNIV